MPKPVNDALIAADGLAVENLASTADDVSTAPLQLADAAGAFEIGRAVPTLGYSGMNNFAV